MCSWADDLPKAIESSGVMKVEAKGDYEVPDVYKTAQCNNMILATDEYNALEKEDLKELQQLMSKETAAGVCGNMTHSCVVARKKA